MRRILFGSYREGRRVVIAVIGATVVTLGAIMIVLPGPALLAIPLGLGILALEFAWARRWLEALRERTDVWAERLRAAVT